ncbi:hypothetical protein NP233_g8785 [Leucocoprinus birnbaumii]|uniref:Major facilitator superfamily (MFS) profile domain-containing protein n=1 Tax=Leucocoprinus birnbaumii TaxID=56174 RepID=A0AAD5YRI3_9AGAR|nr:hypothetical protein NP233_g8785 [Leucocoprinus birnbaumii]
MFPGLTTQPEVLMQSSLRITAVNLNRSEDSFDEKKANIEAIHLEIALDSKPGTQHEVSQVSLSDLQDDCPDGGITAWLVVFGAACCAFGTFGILDSFGVFQAYYEQTLLQDQTPSAIAWIGSTQSALVVIPGVIVGRLFDIGYFRPLFIISSLLLVTATFLIGECTQYWQFLLCQGIAVGLASCGAFGCASTAIAHWFKKKRGRALSYMGVGCAVSGTIFPIGCKKLIPLVGFPWTMRILGFTVLLGMALSNLTVKRRLPPIKTEGKLLDFSVFKDLAFTVFTLAAIFINLGLYTVANYISTSAIDSGSSSEFAFYFVSLFNASSLFGKWSGGYLGDKVGALNVMVPSLLIVGVVTCVWPLLHSTSALIVIIIIYGFCYGSYITLPVVPIMDMGSETDVGSRVGMFFTFQSLGVLAGPPISGAIIARTGGFKEAGAYAGSTVFLGALMLLFVRHFLKTKSR